MNVSSVENVVTTTGGTLTLSAYAQQAGVSTITVSAGAMTLNAAGMTNNLTVKTAGTNNENITTGTGDDTIVFTGATSTLAAGDVINGGAGTDTTP